VIHGRRDEPVRHGSLTAQEYSLALQTARRLQARVSGTFIGATAFPTSGPDLQFIPFRGSCPDGRLVDIRLVWKKDGNFYHLAASDGPPDGPRKASLITMVSRTGKICASVARYRGVGAGPDETLLYGRFPPQ
jgi:hypothetical protein